jgi:formate dehydrogenase iron-sulfur subunit
MIPSSDASAGAPSRISRRRFLQLAAPSAAGLAILGSSVRPASAASNSDPDNAPAILIDVSRCVGCNNCQRCCAAANGLSCEGAPTELSADTYTVIETHAVAAGDERYVKRACMHCLHPGCVSACPVGALHQEAGGAVVADTGKCIGCRYCQYACPFGVPKFEWDNTLGVMRKCTACIERLAQGEKPACVAGCPSGALKSGTRAELLKEAHARIAAQPESYVAKVYGEAEAGGTSRLYLSDVPFEELGLPTVAGIAVPYYADRIVMQTPTVALSVAALSTLTYTLLRRRERNQPGETGETEEKQR